MAKQVARAGLGDPRKKLSVKFFHFCTSTVGVRANPPWLRGLIARGYRIHCGFDTDEAGDAAAAHLHALYVTRR